MRFNRFSVWEKWKDKWQSDDDDGDDVNVKPSSGLQIWNESIFHTPISSFKCHANRHNWMVCALYTFATQFSHIRDVAVAASSLALTHILTVEICVNVSPLWKFRMQKKKLEELYVDDELKCVWWVLYVHICEALSTQYYIQYAA